MLLLDVNVLPAARQGAVHPWFDQVPAGDDALLVGSGPRHLALLRELCDQADAAGDLVPDAVLAAVTAEHNGEVVTLDRDFARFPSVRHTRLPTG